MDRIDATVIGGGVVGLAVARALAQSGQEVLIVEAESAIGCHTSSRNNEVVHAGFLYRPETLKARLCRRGQQLIYEYCGARGNPFRVIGKLMLALSDAEVPALEEMRVQGRACGIEDLELLTGSAASAREPALRCVAALHSPSTGIVDTHAFMLSLLGEAQDRGAAIAFRSRLAAGQASSKRIVLDVHQPTQGLYRLACKICVNAAGLGARTLASAFCGYPANRLPAVHYAKGSFFTLNGRAPFQTLIVPIADTLAKGGAFTLDLAGQGRFGGDSEWVDHVDYRVDRARSVYFVEAIHRYWPDLEPERLAPGYAGIRPRCWGPGEPQGDWVIVGPRDHGIPGLVHLLGIDTPGLTASLAIAEHVLQLLDDTIG
jgi:L-2-hydroxyglutarate oxidase LhgO